MAQAQYDAGRFQDALATAMKIAHPKPAALPLEGWSAYRAGDFQKAADYFSGVQPSDAEYNEAMNGLGFSRLRQERFYLAE